MNQIGIVIGNVFGGYELEAPEGNVGAIDVGGIAVLNVVLLADGIVGKVGKPVCFFDGGGEQRAGKGKGGGIAVKRVVFVVDREHRSGNQNDYVVGAVDNIEGLHIVAAEVFGEGDGHTERRKFLAIG